jgi:hypothetical protein
MRANSSQPGTGTAHQEMKAAGAEVAAAGIDDVPAQLERPWQTAEGTDPEILDSSN